MRQRVEKLPQGNREVSEKNFEQPYREIGAGSAGLVDENEHDSDAQRLVEIYRSKEARRFLVTVTFKTLAVLFAIVALITFASRGSIQWSVASPWLVSGLLRCYTGSLMTIGCTYIAWGMQKWAKGDAEAKQPLGEPR